jgi:hypothetical protein
MSAKAAGDITTPRPSAPPGSDARARSTLANLGERTPTSALWGRRGFLLLLTLVVVADLFGLLGVHTAARTASGGGYQLTLYYPAVGRAGLDVRWHAEVRRPGGFGKQLELAVTADYYDIFESQGLWPQPSSMTRDGRLVYLTFDPPKGDTFMLDFDTYVQPASQVGRTARIAVYENGDERVGLDFTTRLLP